MNEHEARLELHRTISEILFDLAIAPEDELTPDELEATREGMEDITDMIFEALSFEVVAVESGTITATLKVNAG